MDYPDQKSIGERKSGNIRKIVLDRSGCIGARSCALVAEKVFKMDEENLAFVSDDLETTDDKTIQLAAESCPVLVILLYDKDGNKIFPTE